MEGQVVEEEGEETLEDIRLLPGPLHSCTIISYFCIST